MADLSLTVERVIAAPPAVVFDAWLDPEKLMRFMMPGPGMSVPRASSDATEGGRFDIVMKAGEQEIPHSGVYREITRHSRLAFSWVSAFSPEDSLVELLFAPEGEGTHVTLTHTRFLGEQERDNHENGWKSILETLGALFD